MTLVFFRGYTAYELQVGRLIVRFVHLEGGLWTRWTLCRRLSFQWAPKEA